MKAERSLYDSRVIVDFNHTAYNNEQYFLNYIRHLLVLALQKQLSLFAFDSVEFHNTPTILNKLAEYDIIPFNIPPGCTSPIQHLDISVNRPFKDILRDRTEEAIEDWGQDVVK